MADDPYKALGARLEWVRESRERTRAQLADALGITWEGYTSYESGRVRLPIMLIPPIAAALDISNLDLLRLLGIVDDAEAAALVEQWMTRRIERERAKLAAPPVFSGKRLHTPLRGRRHTPAGGEGMSDNTPTDGGHFSWRVGKEAVA